MAGDAAEVGEERAAGCGEVFLLVAFHRLGSLREHRGDVRGFLEGVGSREDLRHQRVRADGVRIGDPFGDEFRTIFRAEVGEQRRVLAEFRHARALGGHQRGVGVAGGAVELREEQAAFAALRGRVEVLVRGVRQDRGRDGLEREVFRGPAEADESVALVRAGDLGDDVVRALVELDGLDARAVEERLAVEAQLELAGGFGAQLERAP